MNWFRLKTCIKCQGDLAADNGDWICLQCGTYYYTGLYRLHSQIADQPRISDPDVPVRQEKQLLGAVTTPQYPASESPAPRSTSVTAMGTAAF